MVVAALIIGALVLGAGMHFFWQLYYDNSPAGTADNGRRYLSLGEQAIRIGEHSLLLQFTLEYEGWGTADTLTRSLPKLQKQVTYRMNQIKTSDLRTLRTPQGKKELAEDVLERVRDALPDDDARKVKGVLYEKFLIGE